MQSYLKCYQAMETSQRHLTTFCSLILLKNLLANLFSMPKVSVSYAKLGL